MKTLFRELTIERQRYGKDEGKMIAKISFQGEKAATTLELPQDTGDKILQLAKQAIIDAVEQSANDFIFEITTGIPETMNLDMKP